jgi:hypothetical protein
MTATSNNRHNGDMELERPTTIESCHSTWIFDTDRMRFRRILKGTDVGGHPVATGWRDYSRLEAPTDAETFTVFLNDSGSRMIRSWRHKSDCTQCSEQLTTALSLQSLRAAINS